VTAAPGRRWGAVIVTGAAGGIGSVIARGVAARHQPVVLVGRDAARLEVARVALGDGADALVGVADVRDQPALEAVVAAAVERYGRIDALVACAAAHGPETLMEATPLAAFEEVFAVNVIGMMASCRAVLPTMRQQGAGNLVLFSSGAGHPIPRPAVRSLAYQLSKFAVEGLVDGLTVELRETGINVNGFRPGRTLAGANIGRGLTGLRRPEQAVEPVLFLASLAPGEMSGYVLEATEFERGFRPARRDYTLA
jgi:NAD(P)-dependent dehydrogenase (short-subunit alcohol dehydrogenase family)